MNDDASRRDVLQALALTVALPEVGDVDPVDEDERRGRAPDLDEDDEMWIVLYAASGADHPAEVDTALWGLICEQVVPRTDGVDGRDLVRRAARGEYDREEIKWRAARVWESYDSRRDFDGD